VIVCGEEAVKLAKVSDFDFIEVRNEVTLILDALGEYPESKYRPEKVLSGTASVKKLFKTDP